MGDLTGELFRLRRRKILQELVEAEITEKPGREPYERRPDSSPPQPAENVGLLTEGLPVAGSTDGVHSVIKAVDAVARGRAHPLSGSQDGNILDKVPEEVRTILKACQEAVRDAPGCEAGDRLVDGLLDRSESAYPSAMRALGRPTRRLSRAARPPS